MNKHPAIVVVEPNGIYREGLLRIISGAGYERCIGVSSLNGVAELDLVNERSVLFLADLGPREDTIASRVRILRTLHPSSSVVLLCETYSHSNLLAAVRAGAQGYLQKSISCDALIRSIDLAALGEPVLPSLVLQLFLTRESIDIPVAEPGLGGSLAKLSAREIEVLSCLSTGSANKVIARRCGITEATVKVHVKAILRKLRAKNRTEAAIMARRHGFGPAPQQFDPARHATHG
jgi:two-component system nitrate/nitrite response regulator NarL